MKKLKPGMFVAYVHDGEVRASKVRGVESGGRFIVTHDDYHVYIGDVIGTLYYDDKEDALNRLSIMIE